MTIASVTPGPRLASSVLDWTGCWIWEQAISGKQTRNSHAFFRRSFTVSSEGTLRIRISADSFYWLHLDGKLIERGPSRAVLDFYTFDELELEISAGPHVLAVLGHHIGEVNACIMTGKPALLVDVQWVVSGNVDPGMQISSGSEWKCLPGNAWKKDLPELMSHFGFWEDCDLAMLPVGWTTVDFDDSHWTPATVVGVPPCPPWSSLAARDIPMLELSEVRVQTIVSSGIFCDGVDDPIPSKTVASRDRREPVAGGAFPWAETIGSEGHYLVCDFGSCLSGFVEIVVKISEPGQILDVSYDDLLTARQTINPERSYAHLTDRFHLPGGGCRIRTLHPRGFRYLMLDISGAGKFEITEVRAIHETYPFRVMESRIPRDSGLRDIFLKSVETLRTCTADAFMDCASRERVQWTQDLYLANRVAYYACGDTRMMRRAVFQAAQNALPDGRINGFFPSERTNCAFASSSLLWLHQAADYWEFTQAEDAVELRPTIERLLAFLETLRDEEGLIGYWPSGQFWDWARIENEGCMLITNAVFFRALERLRGAECFADLIAQDSASAREAAHRRFWDPARELYRDADVGEGQESVFSQQANCMAVWGGICPPELTASLLRRILDPAACGQVPVGEESIDPKNRPSPEKLIPIGTLWFAHFLCETLFESGMSAAALERIRTLWGEYHDLPNYPETRIQHGNTTLCHAWSAGPAYLLPRYAPD